MVLVHKKTFDIYTRIVGDYNKDEYFACDELLAPTIYALNTKGYITTNCCTGHTYPEKQVRPDGEVIYLYDDFYIEFKEKYDFDFEDFPEKAWMDGNVLRIDIETFTNIYEERRDLILEACDSVWKWAIKIPTLEEFKKLTKKNNVNKAMSLYFEYCEDNNVKADDEKVLQKYFEEELLLNKKMLISNAFNEIEIIEEYIDNIKNGLLGRDK